MNGTYRGAGFVVAFLLAVALGVAVPLIAQPAAQTIEPHLVNPDFEDGFTIRESQEVEVAIGWEYAYLQGDDRECRAPCSRPEFKPEQQIVHGGQYSQRWFTTYARQFAVLYQIVDVEPGQWYTFSCMVYAISEPPGQMGAFVGLNPWGNGPFDRTMVWGKEQVGDAGWIYREWTRVSVTAQAFGGRILVALGGNNQWPTKNNAVYWDDCAIVRASGPGPTPEPLPTYTPYPTFTPYPTPQPCPTCSPGGQGCDCATIRAIMREELDNTIWRAGEK